MNQNSAPIRIAEDCKQWLDRNGELSILREGGDGYIMYHYACPGGYSMTSQTGDFNLTMLDFVGKMRRALWDTCRIVENHK